MSIPPTRTTDSEPDREEIGPCARIVDEKREILCGRDGVEEILVRNRFGLFGVSICAICKVEHTAFYAENPSSLRQRGERRRGTQSRGRRRSNASSNSAGDSQSRHRVNRHEA